MHDQAKTNGQPPQPLGAQLTGRLVATNAGEVLVEMVEALGGHEELNALINLLVDRFVDRRRAAAAKGEGEGDTLVRAHLDAIRVGFALARPASGKGM